MITNVGTYNGQSFNLKLESALTNGDDSQCESDTNPYDPTVIKCKIEISSNGAVTFYVKRNKVHPIKFTMINATDAVTPMEIPRFSFSVFDVGALGSGRVCVRP